jgi:hypothetical protein
MGEICRGHKVKLGQYPGSIWVRHRRSRALCQDAAQCRPYSAHRQARASVANASCSGTPANRPGAHRVDGGESGADYCHNCHVTSECFQAHKRGRGSVGGPGPEATPALVRATFAAERHTLPRCRSVLMSVVFASPPSLRRHPRISNPYGSRQSYRAARSCRARRSISLPRSKGIVRLPLHRRNRKWRPGGGAHPTFRGATARITQPVEGAAPVGHEQFYVYLGRSLFDRAPSFMLPKKPTHARMSTPDSGAEARPDLELEVRNNNLDVLIS